MWRIPEEIMHDKYTQMQHFALGYECNFSEYDFFVCHGYFFLFDRVHGLVDTLLPRIPAYTL